MHKGKSLLYHLDSEYRTKIEQERPFNMPNYRTGDVIELTYFQSLSEGKFNTLKGLVYGRAKPNNLRETFYFHTVVDNTHVSLKMKAMSPMIAKVDIVKMGSNKLRQKLNHIPALQLSENRLHEPIIKGKGYKPRSATVDKRKMKVD